MNEKNSFLGNKIVVTSKQIHSNLVLSIPEAIQSAFATEYAEPYFICLNNEIIGYGNLPSINRIKIRDMEQKHWKSLLNSLEANPFQSLLYRQNQITTMHYAYIRSLALL